MTATRGARRHRAALGLALTAATVLTGVGCAPAAESGRLPGDVAARLDAIGVAVAAWQTAADVVTAHRNAETARNLIVGPDGPGYGDADGDGALDGANDIGLLPGVGGEPGLTQPPANACVERDVLGGSWSDPQARWDEFSAVLSEWAPDRNTMPQLASHLQRVVGWATLTLDADSLDVAREYAGHAQLHVDVTRSAYLDCG